MADWFACERGIRRETLEAFGVRTKDNGDVILPYSNGEKLRPDPTKPIGDRRRFYFDAGKVPALFHPLGDDYRGVTAAFLVEGETDAMRLRQELNGCAIFGLSGCNVWGPQHVEELRQFEQVVVILDNDGDYLVTAQVDAAWKRIRNDLGSRARRLRLPHDVKDVCEFFDAYDLDTLRMLWNRKTVSESRYRPLDLLKEPPPVKWLVDEWFAMGDVTLLMGDSGLGKSWLTMALCIAVAQGWPDLLEHEVREHGRVLYVDEENPADVVYDRLKRLGLTPDGTSNIRYLHNEGIRLDRTPDEFLEEALDFNPTVIVLDSLTRIHTEDENSSGAMSRLYNDGIKPLARETGAAVVLIHHAGKSDGSSHKRVRGSSDILAAVDAAIDIRPTEPYAYGAFNAKPFKSRRRKGGEGLDVMVEDMDDGSARLVPNPKLDPPF